MSVPLMIYEKLSMFSIPLSFLYSRASLKFSSFSEFPSENIELGEIHDQIPWN